MLKTRGATGAPSRRACIHTCKPLTHMHAYYTPHTTHRTPQLQTTHTTLPHTTLPHTTHQTPHTPHTTHHTLHTTHHIPHTTHHTPHTTHHTNNFIRSQRQHAVPMSSNKNKIHGRRGTI